MAEQDLNAIAFPTWTEDRKGRALRRRAGQKIFRGGILLMATIATPSFRRKISAVGEGEMAVPFVHEYLNDVIYD